MSEKVYRCEITSLGERIGSSVVHSEQRRLFEVGGGLNVFNHGERVVVIAESEYERLLQSQPPEREDVVDAIRRLAVELSVFTILLNDAGLEKEAGKALDIGVALDRLANAVNAKREEH